MIPHFQLSRLESLPGELLDMVFSHLKDTSHEFRVSHPISRILRPYVERIRYKYIWLDLSPLPPTLPNHQRRAAPRQTHRRTPPRLWKGQRRRRLQNPPRNDRLQLLQIGLARGLWRIAISSTTTESNSLRQIRHSLQQVGRTIDPPIRGRLRRGLPATPTPSIFVVLHRATEAICCGHRPGG